MSNGSPPCLRPMTNPDGRLRMMPTVPAASWEMINTTTWQVAGKAGRVGQAGVVSECGLCEDCLFTLQFDTRVVT